MSDKNLSTSKELPVHRYNFRAEKQNANYRAEEALSL
jgi:hypothetical protein